MDVKECLEKGLLKKERPDIEKTKRSLDMADEKLKLAQRSIEAGIYENALLNIYSAVFHAERALLFRDGYKERSHFATYVYIKERYASLLEPRLINEINNLRIERHGILYGLEGREIGKEEVESILLISGDFVNAVKRIIMNQLPKQ